MPPHSAPTVLYDTTTHLDGHKERRTMPSKHSSHSFRSALFDDVCYTSRWPALACTAVRNRSSSRRLGLEFPTQTLKMWAGISPGTATAGQAASGNGQTPLQICLVVQPTGIPGQPAWSATFSQRRSGWTIYCGETLDAQY